MALSRLTKDVVGEFFTRNTRIAFGHGCDHSNYVNAKCNFIQAIGNGNLTNSTEYYDNGWVKSRTGQDGQTTSYEYWADGQTMTVTDPLNHQTSYFYDDAGRQTQVWDALNHPTYFGYDALGQQVTTTFADGSSVTNQFNNVGQRVGQIDQAGLRTQFGYNVSGLLTNVTDALNHKRVAH